MRITRTISQAVERCEILLELDFATRVEALHYILDTQEIRKAISDEIYNADAPCVWITFRIAGNSALLGIQLTQ